MGDPRGLRNTRLENEYKELMELNKLGQMIRVEPLDREKLHEKYKVTFNVRTIIGPEPSYRNQTVCTLTLPADYPDAEPILTANQKPYPFHINWYTGGRWCCGHWTKMESIVNFLFRAARTLQFDPEIADRNSVANKDAIPFWDANCRNHHVMPCDKQPLPVSSSPRITVKSITPALVAADKPSKSKIQIIGRH